LRLECLIDEPEAKPHIEHGPAYGRKRESDCGYTGSASETSAGSAIDFAKGEFTCLNTRLAQTIMRRAGKVPVHRSGVVFHERAFPSHHHRFSIRVQEVGTVAGVPQLLCEVCIAGAGLHTLTRLARQFDPL
jgi:hypothetical protein